MICAQPTKPRPSGDNPLRAPRVIDPSHPLLLGSASPRRREILAILRVPIVIAPSDADEVPRPTESPSDYLARVVREKLLSVAPHARTLTIGGVIVADTLVLLDDTILGKPSSVAEAASMVRRLSGRRHEVWTRFGIARPEAPDVHVHEETVRTAVVFSFPRGARDSPLRPER